MRRPFAKCCASRTGRLAAGFGQRAFPPARFLGGLVPAVFALALFSGAAPGVEPRQDVVAIIDATVVDATGASPRLATVIVRGGRIAALGPKLPIPSGARVIPADGLTLIPGLFDVHEHVPYSAVRGFRGDWVKNLYACLASGVTTVVDFGRDAESFAEVRRILGSGRLQATPHVLMAARFATPLGHGAELGRDWFSSLVLTPQQAAAAFETVLPERPDAVKVFVDGWRYGNAPEMASMRADTLGRLVELAHEAGLPVLTHTVTLERSKIAAEAGVDVLAHAVSDRRADSGFADLIRRKSTCYAPTMAVYEPEPLDLSQPLFKEVVEPAVRERIPPPAGIPVSTSDGPGARWSNILANTRELHQAGAQVILGTDAGVTGTYHGWAALRELELMVEAGLSPLAAIEAGTRDSADCLGLLADRGTIEVGKRADLVLIEGKPHEDIHDIWKIRRVFLSGQDVPRSNLVSAIQGEAPIAPDTRVADRDIDDFEDPSGRARTGALWRADFESGHVTTSVVYERIWRAEGDHALMALFHFATQSQPFGQLTLPLARGAVATVDASGFDGVEFEARGDGPARMTVETLEVRDENPYGEDFTLGPSWERYRIRFDALRTTEAGHPVAWSPGHLVSIGFLVKGEAGEKRFVELDNVRFWKDDNASGGSSR